MAEVLRGSLEHFSLATLLQLVEMEGSTGVLRIAEEGRIDFSRGDVVGSTLGRWSGLDALYELFLVRVGTFLFDQSDVQARPPIGALMQLVVEGSRRADEWARLAPCGFEVTGAPSTLPSVLQSLVPMLKAGLPLLNAAARADVPRVRLVDPVRDAVGQGLLREVSAAASGDLLSGDLDTLMSRGRSLVREGRLEEARVAFTLALQISPEDRVAAQNLRRITTLLERNQ